MLFSVPWSAYVLLGKFLGTMLVLGTTELALMFALYRWTGVSEKQGFGVSLAVVLVGWQGVIWPLTRDWYAVSSVPASGFTRALGVALVALVALFVAILAMTRLTDTVRLTQSD